MSKDEDLLKEAREAFERAAEVEADNRLEALDDIRFARMADQWPLKVKQQRELEGRPCLTINKMPAFIRQVVNDTRQNSPSIKVHPADGDADVETAEIINGLIRNIEYTSDADVAYDTAAECAVGNGFGYFRIDLDWSDDDTFDKDLKIRRIANPFTVYGDPDSQAADSSDWNTAFVVETLPKAVFEKKYKGAQAVDWDATGYTGLKMPWYGEDEVMIAEYWKREEVARTIVALSNGQIVEESVYAANKDLFDQAQIEVVASRPVRSHKVTQRLMTGAEVLETNDWIGRYIPIVPVYGDEVNLEGRRFFRSLIRDAKDSQRNFNYWRTTATELVALAPKAPFIGPKGSFKSDAAKWASANTETHAHIEYDVVAGGAPPQRQPFAGVPAGAIQEALNASDDMKAIIGIFDAGLGARSNETSGRAILARQKEGDVSTFHFADNLSRAIRHAGRIILDLIPHVYTQDRVVRVMGLDGSPRTVPLGKPTPRMGPDGKPMMGPQMDPNSGQPVMGPDGQPLIGPLTRIFDLALGKYDLTVETGPSYTTQREEAAEQMMELIRSFPQAAPVIGDLIAKNLDWPGAEEIAQRLQAMMQAHTGAPQGQPQQDPTKMAMVQLKAGELAVKQQHAQVQMYEAQTDRLRATVEAQRPVMPHVAA